MLGLRRVGSRPGRWFDIEGKRPVVGQIYEYEATVPHSGRWILSLRIAGDKAIMQARFSEGTTLLHNQITGRKSEVFRTSVKDGFYYNLIGIGCVDTKGRYHCRRISSEEEVPEEIRNQFILQVYEDAVPGPVSARYSQRRKLVALVPKNKPEQMAKLFMLQRICPIDHLFESKKDKNE